MFFRPLSPRIGSLEWDFRTPKELSLTFSFMKLWGPYIEPSPEAEAVTGLSMIPFSNLLAFVALGMEDRLVSQGTSLPMLMRLLATGFSIIDFLNVILLVIRLGFC